MKNTRKASPVLEKEIEQKLVQAVKNRGGLCPKFFSPGLAGVPDRIILMPGERIAFAELKAPGNQLRPLQVTRIRQLRRLGFTVYVIDNEERIGGVLDAIQAP